VVEAQRVVGEWLEVAFAVEGGGCLVDGVDE
jgi:hypothetical protein